MQQPWTARLRFTTTLTPRSRCVKRANHGSRMWIARFLLFPFPAALTERNCLVHFDFLNLGVLVSDADADIGGFS